MRPSRAVIFDMDDTLYPHRRFVLSGFAAVAGYLQQTHQVDRRLAFTLLRRASRGPHCGRELQACLETLRLPAALASDLLEVIRRHVPTLRWRKHALRTIAQLRSGGWRIGVLTNGTRDVQAGKISALDLERHTDAIVYAPEHGSGAGKPEPEPFAEVLRRLDVHPHRAVLVGDDEWCDVVGAANAGLSAIRWTAWKKEPLVTQANATAHSWSAIPALAERLIVEAAARHAA